MKKKKSFANTGTVFIYFSGHGHQGSLGFHKKGKEHKGSLEYRRLYETIREEILNQYDIEQDFKAESGEEKKENKNESSIIKIQLVIDACHSGSAVDEFNPSKM